MKLSHRLRPSRLAAILWPLPVVLALFQQDAQAKELDFFEDVQPTLQQNCLPCHNKKTTKGGLNLETPESARKGGESGEGLIPGKAAESLIFKSATHQGESAMPPKNNKSGAVDLTAAELAALRTWIDQGAKTSTRKAQTITLQALPSSLHPIYGASITADGRHAACSRAGRLYLYDLARKTLVAQLHDPALKDGAAHQDLIQGLHFSPDGERLASGGFREVKIWKREREEASSRKIETQTPQSPVGLSQDGRQSVVVGPSGLRIIDVKTGAILRELPEAPKEGISVLSISSDGTLLALCTKEGALSVWALQDGSKRAAFSGHAGTRMLAWMQDGKALLTGCEDKSLHAWPLDPEVRFKDLPAAAAGITSIAQGTDQDQFIVITETGLIQIHSLQEARMQREVKINGVPVASGMSADRRWLAVGCADSSIRLLEVSTLKQTLELRQDSDSEAQMLSAEWEDSRAELDFSHHTAVIAKIDAAAKALEILSKKATDAIAAAKKELPEKQKALVPAQEARAAAEKAANDAAAALASTSADKPDAALQAKSKEAVTKLAAAIMSANSASAAVSAAENHVKDGEEQLLHIAENKTKNNAEKEAAQAGLEVAKKIQAAAQARIAALKLAANKMSRKPLSVCFSNSGDSIAAVFNDGTQQIWSTASGTPLEMFKSTGAISAACIVDAAGGRFTSIGSDGTLRETSGPVRWKLESVLGGAPAASPFAGRVCAVKFSPDGTVLAAGGGETSRSGEVLLWDVQTKKLLQHWKELHGDSVLSLDFSPDGQWLASGSADKMARVSEVKTGKQVYLLEAHTHHVMGVAFRADGRILATSGGDGVVNTWDMHSGERAKKIIGWNKEVTALQFMGASHKIVTSSAENQIRIVLDSGTEVRAMTKLPDFMQATASAKAGPFVIGGGEDSTLRLWDANSGAELAAFTAPQ